jgi:hypothetical protein
VRLTDLLRSYVVSGLAGPAHTRHRTCEPIHALMSAITPSLLSTSCSPTPVYLPLCELIHRVASRARARRAFASKSGSAGRKNAASGQRPRQGVGAPNPTPVATLRSVFRVIVTACSERFSAANTRLARSVVTDRVASNPCVDVRPRAQGRRAAQPERSQSDSSGRLPSTRSGCTNQHGRFMPRNGWCMD